MALEIYKKNNFNKLNINLQNLMPYIVIVR